MAIHEDFTNAQAESKKLAKTPRNDELLKLYALYKQGALGDASGKRPGMLDIRGRAKFDAWSALKGTGMEDAQSQYVSLVQKLVTAYGTT